MSFSWGGRESSSVDDVDAGFRVGARIRERLMRLLENILSAIVTGGTAISSN